MKTVVEEIREVCSLCGGHGQEASYGTTAMFQMCRRCHGAGQTVTKTVTRHEEFNIDELADAVSRRIAEQSKR
jgi:DnaJ-class molecular chaperone